MEARARAYRSRGKSAACWVRVVLRKVGEGLALFSFPIFMLRKSQRYFEALPTTDWHCTYTKTKSLNSGTTTMSARTAIFAVVTLLAAVKPLLSKPLAYGNATIPPQLYAALEFDTVFDKPASTVVTTSTGLSLPTSFPVLQPHSQATRC